MKTHLEEHEMSAAVAGLELETTAEEHLGSCMTCRQQVSATRAVIDVRLGELEAETPDWDRQRQEIMLKLPLRPTVQPFRRRPWARPLLAIAAVLVVAIGLRVLWTPTPGTDPGVVSDLPVEQILAEVDAMLADDTIPGLELLDQGMDDAIFENGAS